MKKILDGLRLARKIVTDSVLAHNEFADLSEHCLEDGEEELRATILFRAQELKHHYEDCAALVAIDEAMTEWYRVDSENDWTDRGG